MNEISSSICSANFLVLIDTWWNVNSVYPYCNKYRPLVLIDTWWNVNCNAQRSVPCRYGFNRYMVECECGYC